MRILAIVPGRYHPPHPGHAASFAYMVKRFGINNTYFAMSQKQEQPRSPFAVSDRAKMCMCLGVPKENIISVHYPYSSKEYLERFNLDPQQTCIVFGVGKKDMAENPRFTFEGDGVSPSYMQPYPQDGQNLEPASSRVYVVTTPTTAFQVHGKQLTDAHSIRNMYATSDSNNRDSMLSDLYGKYSKHLKPIFDANIRLDESIIGYIRKIKSKLSEANSEQRQRILQLVEEVQQYREKIIENTIVDYLDENVVPADLFPGKEMKARKEGLQVIYKQKVVGKTTGEIVDDRVEFVRDDGDYGYLPLDVVSIR